MKMRRLRSRIDRADRKLFQALGERFQAVQELGVLKRKLGIPVLQKTRWKEVMQERLALAESQGLSERFAKKFLKLIHEEAIRVQKAKKRSRKK